MDTHLFFAQEILLKFYANVPMFSFLKIFMKLHWVANPTHEQIKAP
jgi:hypothetical protein